MKNPLTAEQNDALTDLGRRRRVATRKLFEAEQALEAVLEPELSARLPNVTLSFGSIHSTLAAIGELRLAMIEDNALSKLDRTLESDAVNAERLKRKQERGREKFAEAFLGSR